MSEPSLKVTADFTKEFNQIVSKFKRDRVLVGVPEDEASRGPTANQEGEENGSITNAALLAINHFGVDELHIPPRPVLEIGIRLAQEAIAEELKKATIEALSQGFRAIDKYYDRAGIIASNSVKHVITDQINIEGPAKSTLATRAAAGFKGTDALVVTGQLRNSITYVVQGDS